MKVLRIFSILLAVALMLALVSCGKETPADESSKAASETTSEPDLSTEDTSSEAESSEPEESSEESSEPEEEAEGRDDVEQIRFDHILITLPDGFQTTVQGDVPMAVPADYPNRTDNIAFSADVAGSIDDYSKESFEQLYNALVPGFEGIAVFEKTKIGANDMLLAGYTLTVEGISMEQLQLIIFGDTFTDVVTFTSVSGEFDDAFESCMKSIQVTD